MAALQQPKFVYMQGQLRPWAEATLHVGCEAVNRGLSVFEGLKGYWQPDGTFAVVMLEQHFARLKRSARVLHIPFDTTLDEYAAAIDLLASALLERERDMWFRTTLFVTEGNWGEGTRGDLVITAYHQDKLIPAPIHLGISTWQRSSDISLPARVKTSSNYQVARLARIDGRRVGCSDMVLLNNAGRVAEATGSCIMLVRDGAVITPPATEGCLESITLDLVHELALSMEIPFIRRPVDRTELLVAEEMALCGTLAEVVLVKSIDSLPLPDTPKILQSLQARYFEAIKGVRPHSALKMFPLNSAATAPNRR
jgi:branched-chain amino acid aminotransferase